MGVRAARGCWGGGFGTIGCVVGWGYCVDLGVFGSLGSVERGLWRLVRVGSMDRTFLGRRADDCSYFRHRVVGAIYV